MGYHPVHAPAFDAPRGIKSVHRSLNQCDPYVSSGRTRPTEVHFLEGAGQRVLPSFVRFDGAHWEPAEVAGVATHRLMGDAQIVYLCSHGGRSRWLRLKWLLDVRRLTRHFAVDDWLRLLSFASDQHEALYVEWGAAMIRDVFGTSGAPGDTAERAGALAGEGLTALPRRERDKPRPGRLDNGYSSTRCSDLAAGAAASRNWHGVS
jgi:hypothetical protein